MMQRARHRAVLGPAIAAGLALAAACSGPSGPAGAEETNRSGSKAIGPSDAAELVLLGGDVITMSPERPRAQALAVRDGMIAAVGSDGDVRALIGPATRIIELGGRSVTPGLVDGHCHLYGLGGALDSVSLRGMTSATAAAHAVAKAADGRPSGEWIVGRGWDQNLWTPAQFPHHSVLDAVVPDHPVAVRRIDGHALWANRAAMTMAGITRTTADPPGGRIVRDERGEATGVFIDTAMPLIEKHIPEPPAAVRRRRILQAAAMAVQSGLTGVHEMGIDATTAAVYRELAERGELPLRVDAYMSRPELLSDLSAPGRGGQARRSDSFFRVRGVKLYADGALGSRGAAMLAPYSDAPQLTGNTLLNADEIARVATQLTGDGWQLAIHAIGDAANRAVLDGYQVTLRERQGDDLRLRIEHAQIVAPADLPRFAALGVLASMQPTHATSDMPWAEARVGAERIRGAYAWRTLLASGARIVSGSDFPVEEVSPLLGLYAAVTRSDLAGQPPAGWYPEQRMTLDEAVKTFTIDAAYAVFAEDRRGRLQPGYAADITVYDRALSADMSLLQTQIDLTVVGGRVVHERPRSAR
ncbi:MAG: amidohydrolase [Myxococcota bacterium]